MSKSDISPKEFSNLLFSIQHKPNKNLIKRIDSKMFPLDNNPIFNYKPEQLAFQEYKRCLELFQKRNPSLKPEEAINRIPGVQSLITKAEAPIKKELEDLCISTIKEIYQIPDYVDLKTFIQPKLSFDTEQDYSSKTFIELSLDKKKEMIESIRLRETHVSCIHGSSMNSWKGIYHLVSEEINKLNPSLMELYDYYTSLVSICLWQINPDMFQQLIEDGVQITQGYSEVKSNKDFGAKIQANGINFPTLIHECNKGVMSYLFHAGVPSHYNEAELEYYYKIGDSYLNEPYHYLFGPTIWSGLLETAQVPNETIPHLIRKLVKLNLKDTIELFRLILDNPELAKEKIKQWKL